MCVVCVHVCVCVYGRATSNGLERPWQTAATLPRVQGRESSQLSTIHVCTCLCAAQLYMHVCVNHLYFINLCSFVCSVSMYAD